MATAELPEDATTEDIQKFVDQVAEDREGEQSDEKADAQRIAEENNKPTEEVTATETESGDGETAKADTGNSEGQAEWLDDDLKAEVVAAYGIDEKDLADFTSREELDRALRFFDRSAMDAGRKALAEGEETKTRARDERGQFQKKEPESGPTDGQYKAGLSEIWDGDAKGELEAEFTRLRDQFGLRLDDLESQLAEATDQAKGQRFDVAVDAMGHADLFGKTGKENSKQLQRREDLLVASEAQQIGLERLGRKVGPGQYESLVNRVANMVFSVELGKKALKARTHKISKQADGRMGGGDTKPTDVPESARDEAERLYKEIDGP